MPRGSSPGTVGRWAACQSFWRARFTCSPGGCRADVKRPCDSLGPITPMPKRIAIVEDEAELAALIDYNLSRNGYETRTFGASGGVLNSLEEFKPDLVVLDVMLPEVDGFELCRQIRQSAALGRIPVLFLTARSDEVDRVLGLEIGGDDYRSEEHTSELQSLRHIVCR